MQMMWTVALNFQHAIVKLMRSIDNQQLGDVPLVMQQRLSASCLLFMAAVGKKAQDLYSQVNKCLSLPACLSVTNLLSASS